MNGNVILGNCLEVLADMERESVDCIVTDPPYGDTSLTWDVPVLDWLAAIGHVLKPSGSVWCFGSMRMFMEQAGCFESWTYAQEIVWEKHNGSGFHADRFKRVHEIAVQWYKGPWADIYKQPVMVNEATARTVRRKKRPPHTGHIEAGSYASVDGGPKLMRSVIYAPSCHGYAEHPTQKPTEILRPLIEYSCPPGGLVLDPFAGSGSTGVAAREVGRDYLLIEIDPNYYAVAERRLSQLMLDSSSTVSA